MHLVFVLLYLIIIPARIAEHLALKMFLRNLEGKISY